MGAYSFNKRFLQLTSMDNIRKFKIIEMIQYSFIFFVLSFVVATILNKTYYKDINQLDIVLEKNTKSTWKFIQLLLLVFFETLFLTILVFYMRKLVLLIPSYGSYKDKKFIPFTTISYVADFTLLFAFIEMLPEYRKQFDRLGSMMK
tara:strand:+ start:1032 stop:1472 length:441 start_codon:yes stop_codon:yes gene_type:complete